MVGSVRLTRFLNHSRAATFASAGNRKCMRTCRRQCPRHCHMSKPGGLLQPNGLQLRLACRSARMRGLGNYSDQAEASAQLPEHPTTVAALVTRRLGDCPFTVRGLRARL